jgi:hypothetical protein
MRFWTSSHALPTVRFHQWLMNIGMACLTIMFHFQRSFTVLSVELNRKFVMTGDLPGLRMVCVLTVVYLTARLLLGYLSGRAEENHEILWSE